MTQKAALVLSNGKIFEGELIGVFNDQSGEMVFTTAMVGYNEALTDPSYFGQILVFTYPLIGNYGISKLFQKNMSLQYESHKIWPFGIIMAKKPSSAFHWQADKNLEQWLVENKTPAIVNIDTRALVQEIRRDKNLFGKIVPHDQIDHHISFFDPSSQEILQHVVQPKVISHGQGSFRIGLIDCGVKWNIIRLLQKNNCEVLQIPWNDDFEKYNCDAWVLSNGPGDPKLTGNLVHKIQQLMTKKQPILGICLGNQILALAAGFETKRLEYGHRGHNQPVYEVSSQKAYMTSQNHGHVVIDERIPQDWEIWFKNANDQSIEGIKHKKYPFQAVQFHPEAAGGPRDTSWIIDQFVESLGN